MEEEVVEEVAEVEEVEPRLPWVYQMLGQSA